MLILTGGEKSETKKGEPAEKGHVSNLWEEASAGAGGGEQD